MQYNRPIETWAKDLVSPYGILITKNGKNSNFTAENHGTYRLNQVIKVNLTSNKKYRYYMPSDVTH